MIGRLLRRLFTRPEPVATGSGWKPVARVADFTPGRLKAVVVDGVQIAIGRDAKKSWFAVQRRCPHKFGDLAAGTIDRDALVCPDHKYRFSITTGRHDGASDHCLVRYAVRVVGDTVEIDPTPLSPP